MIIKWVPACGGLLDSECYQRAMPPISTSPDFWIMILVGVYLRIYRTVRAFYRRGHSMTATWTPSPLAGPNLSNAMLPVVLIRDRPSNSLGHAAFTDGGPARLS